MTHTTQIAARPYTLAEVDAMRAAQADLMRAGGHDGYGSLAGEYHRAIEDVVRTNMMAGIEPADMVEAARIAMEARRERKERRARDIKMKVDELVAGGMDRKQALREAHGYGPKRPRLVRED